MSFIFCLLDHRYIIVLLNYIKYIKKYVEGFSYQRASTGCYTSRNRRADSMIKVFCYRLDDSIRFSDDDLENLNISKSRKEKIKRFKVKKSRIASAFAEILLAYGIKDYFGIEYKDMEIEYIETGKPYCSNHKNLYYNISHSNQWIACGVATSEIGIDTEVIQGINIAIAKRFFASEEYEIIKQTPAPIRNKIFIKYWTLKESYVKALGTGLSTSLDTFYFKFPKDEIKLKDEIEFYNQGELDDSYLFHTFELDDENLISVCSRTEEPVEIEIVDDIHMKALFNAACSG